MANFFIYALGTGGDIDPMVGLGVELKNRGHQVVYLSNAYFKQTIVDAGLNFHSVGTTDQYHKGNSAKAWQGSDDADNFEFYHAPAFEPSYNYIKSIPRETMPVLLALGEQNGAVAAALQCGISFIRIILTPNIIFSAISPPAPLCWKIPKDFPPFLSKALLRLFRKTNFMRSYKSPAAEEYLATRKRLKCPLKFRRKSTAIMQLGLFPEWFGMRSKDWPADLKLIGFPLQNRVDMEFRTEIDAVIGRLGAPIIFTAGTGVPDVTELFCEGRKICEMLRVPGVFVGGVIGKEVLEGSPLCAHLDYIDFAYALPKSLAIVHHGGIGTTAQAIKAGIPQLIRPVKYDQPDNANRVYKLGLGNFVLPQYFKSETVAPLLAAMLHCSKNNRILQTYSAELKTSNAINEACNLIEQTSSALHRKQKRA